MYLYNLLSQKRSELLNLVAVASEAAMEIYNSDNFGVKTKGDGSPVGKADLEVNRILTEGLHRLTPNIPVVSEEAQIPYGIRKNWFAFWILDPIDGTKEFIAKTGEFTVNVGLVIDQKPAYGLISIPVDKTIYHGGPFFGSSYIPSRTEPYSAKIKYQVKDGKIDFPLPEAICKVTRDKSELVVCRSKDHATQQDLEFISNLPASKALLCGSTIKCCKIAEGAAHFYVRFGGINEWDLAAAHAIIKGAGGEIVGLDSEDLIYNTESMRLPPLIAHANIDFAWWNYLPNDSDS